MITPRATAKPLRHSYMLQIRDEVPTISHTTKQARKAPMLMRLQFPGCALSEVTTNFCDFFTILFQHRTTILMLRYLALPCVSLSTQHWIWTILYPIFSPLMHYPIYHSLKDTSLDRNPIDSNTAFGPYWSQCTYGLRLIEIGIDTTPAGIAIPRSSNLTIYGITNMPH